MYTNIIAKRLAGRPSVVLAISLLALGTLNAQGPSSALASRALPTSLKAANASPIYCAHRLLVAARVPGGIVWSEDVGEAASIEVPKGMGLGDALTSVLGWQDRYYWRESAGVINILPRSGLPRLLEVNIAEYGWRSDESPSAVVWRLQQLPEIVQQVSRIGYVDGLHHGPGLQKPPHIGPPPDSEEPPRAFVRRDITLFELLNDIARSFPDPVIWAYHEWTQGRSRALTIDAR